MTDLPGGERLQVSESLQYQAGGIVSRMILKKDTGSVTLFAFDKGQDLSEHSAPFDALVHVVEGKAEVLIGGEPQEVPAGEMILLPANIPHALKALEKFKMILTMIRS